MKFTKKNIQKSYRNGELVVNSTNKSSTVSSSGGSSNSGNFLPASPNGDGTYTVNLDKVTFNGSIVASGDVSAYGKGNGSESGQPNPITVINNLDSDSVGDALSAAMGKKLKSMIGTGGSGNVDLENYYTKDDINTLLENNADTIYVDKKISDLVNGAPETMDTLKELSDALAINKDAVDAINKSITNKADKDHKHTVKDITDLNTEAYDNHIKDQSKHVTQKEKNNWNNKLDKAIWDKAFDLNGDNLKVKLNIIGEKEVSAYGGSGGSGGSGGIFTIADNLTTNSSDAALSARQGVILKGMIDSKTVDVDLSNYYKKNEVDTLFQPKGSYLTSHQSLDHLAKKDGSNANGVWDISIYGNAGSSNYSSFLKVADNRDVDEEPHQKDAGFYADFKSRDRNGLNDGGIWSGVLTFRPYGTGGDFSGGYSHQLGFTQNENIWYRKATDNYTWGDWIKMAKVTDNVASANGLKEGDEVWTANYNPTNVKNPTWLCGWNASNHTLEAVDRASLSVNYANFLQPYQKNEGSDKVLISGTRSDNTWSRSLVDDGWRLQFRGIRPQYEGSNIATVNDLSSYIPKSGGTLTGHLYFNDCNIGLNTNWITGNNGIGLIRMDENSNTVIGCEDQSTSVTVRSGSFKAPQIYSTSKLHTAYNYGMMCGLPNGDEDYILYYDNTGKAHLSYNSRGVYVDGSLLATGEVTAHSDRRLKKDIKPLENRGFIQPVTYTKDGKKSIGFIAQDVREKYPELVSEDNTENKYLSLNYSQYTAVLESQIIELNNKLNDMQNQINKLSK